MGILLSITIPTQSGGHNLPQEMVSRWRETAEEFFLDTCGGCTISEASGAWKDDNGKVHREKVHVVSALANGHPKQLRVARFRLRCLAREMARKMGQLAVLTTCVPSQYAFIKPDLPEGNGSGPRPWVGADDGGLPPWDPRRTPSRLEAEKDVTLKDIEELAEFLFY